MKIIFLAIILTAVFFVYEVSAGCPSTKPAGMVYCEDFDDQAFDVPTLGTINVQVGNCPGCATSPWCPSVGGAIEGIHYNMTNLGLEGEGYCFHDPINSSCSKDPYPILVIPANSWPSDEMFVSYWVRFQNFERSAYSNIKMYYSRWDGVNSYTSFASAGTLIPGNEAFYYSSHNRTGGILEQSTYVIVPNFVDGNWHKMSFWNKFSTAEFKFWYDKNYTEEPTFYRDYVDGSWTNNVYYVTAFKEDAGDETNWTYRELDNWEVWDKLPTQTSGPLLYWNLDSVNVVDSSGNGYDGTVYRTSFDSNGKVGGSYKFSSFDEPINHSFIWTNHVNPYSPNSLDMVGGSEVSYFAWVKSDKNLVDLGSLWDSYVLFKPKYSFLLGWSGWSHDGWECNIWNESNSNQRAFVYNTRPQVAGEWVHLGCVFNGTFLGLYVNGVLAAFNDSIPNYRIQNNTLGGEEYYNFFVGSKNQYAYYNLTWDGNIDEVKVFDRALSSSEVYDMYQESALEGDINGDGKVTTNELVRYIRGFSGSFWEKIIDAIRGWLR